MADNFKQNLRKKTQRIMLISALRGFLMTLMLIGVAYYVYMAGVFFVPQIFYFSKYLQYAWWFALITTPCIVATLSALVHFKDDNKLVMAIEKQYPHLRDRLQTAVEVNRLSEGKDIDPFSAALAKSLEKEMNQILNRFGFHRLASFKKLIVPFIFFIVLFASTITHAMIQPHFFRLSSPDNNAYEAPVKFFNFFEKDKIKLKLFEISIHPGHCEIGKGQNLMVEVQTPGYDAQKITLYLKHPNDAAWRAHEMKRYRKGHFQYQLRHITESGVYFVRADQQKSEKYKIKIYEPISIERVGWTIIYPEYTKMPKETRQGWGTKFSVPLNSELKLDLKTNRPIKKAYLVSLAHKKIPLKILEDGTLRGALEIKQDEILNLELIDENDEIVLGLPKTWVQVIPDLLPYLEVLEPQNHNYSFKTEEIPFKINLDDDYGIESVTLVLRYHGKEERIDWLKDQGVPKEINLKPLLQLEDLDLKSREMIFAHVEVKDNYPHEEHIVKSQLFSFLIRDYVEQFKLNAKENKEISMRKLFEGILVDQEKIMSDAWDYLSRLPSNDNPVLSEKSAGGYAE